MHRYFRICLCAGLLVAASNLRADEQFPVLKIAGETYSNVTVTSVTATDVYFTHSRGLGNAKLKNLSPELQKHFHYDLEKAIEAEQNQSFANMKFHQGVAAAAKPAGAKVARPAGGAKDTNDVIIPVPQIYARPFLGQHAPPFVVEKWLTDIPDSDGKFVLIDFWATWCGPCRRSIPHLNHLYAKFSSKVAFVGVSDESEADVRAMKDPKIDYAVAIDTKQRMLKTVGVKGIPHAMLIDPKGIVRFEGMPTYLDDDGLSRLITRYSD